MGPSMVAFLKEVYGRAKEADKFLMSQQPALKHTWNTMVASSFWDMRLSIACAATDVEYQNRIILHDNTSTRALLEFLKLAFFYLCFNRSLLWFL